MRLAQGCSQGKAQWVGMVGRHRLVEEGRRTAQTVEHHTIADHSLLVAEVEERRILDVVEQESRTAG